MEHQGTICVCLCVGGSSPIWRGVSRPDRPESSIIFGPFSQFRWDPPYVCWLFSQFTWWRSHKVQIYQSASQSCQAHSACLAFLSFSSSCWYFNCHSFLRVGESERYTGGCVTCNCLEKGLENSFINKNTINSKVFATRLASLRTFRKTLICGSTKICFRKKKESTKFGFTYFWFVAPKKKNKSQKTSCTPGSHGTRCGASDAACHARLPGFPGPAPRRSWVSWERWKNGGSCGNVRYRITSYHQSSLETVWSATISFSRWTPVLVTSQDHSMP